MKYFTYFTSISRPIIDSINQLIRLLIFEFRTYKPSFGPSFGYLKFLQKMCQILLETPYCAFTFLLSYKTLR